MARRTARRKHAQTLKLGREGAHIDIG